MLVVESQERGAQVRNVELNTARVLVDSSGHPLPPCIVMERGESLDIWAARARPDRTQAFVVRCARFHLYRTTRSFLLSMRSQCTPSCGSVASRFNSTTRAESVKCQRYADDAPTGSAYERLPCARLRAPRPQARQRDVAAARESLDRHRLWLRCPHRGACQPELQPCLRRARSDIGIPPGRQDRACPGIHCLGSLFCDLL